MLHLDYIITGAWEDITHYQGYKNCHWESDMDGILIIKVLFGYSKYQPCTCRLLFIKLAAGKCFDVVSNTTTAWDITKCCRKSNMDHVLQANTILVCLLQIFTFN